MAQSDKTLSNTPQLVAIGPGSAMFEGKINLVQYWVGTDQSYNSSASPFTVEKENRESMVLEDGEGLWLAGKGLCVVYAKVEPVQ